MDKIGNLNEKRDQRCLLTIGEELEAIKLYESGSSLSQVSRKLGLRSSHSISNAFNFWNVKRRSSGEGVRLLHRHLDVKTPHRFPFHLENKFHKLIAIFLLTDGCLNKSKIQLICTDRTLQNYFLSLLKFKFNLRPTPKAYMFNGKETSLNSKKIAKKLLLLSPTYNTYPVHKSKSSYYKSAQPSLKFLEKEDKRTIIECIRLAMACEGSISTELPRNTVYPYLQFACSHPELLEEWRRLFQRVGIKSFIKNSKATWSGVGGLVVKELKSIKRFIEIGGFIDGVKVTGKSKYYKGIEKNKLLKLLVKMREDSFYFPRSLIPKQKNNLIRKMLINPSIKKKYWKCYVVEPKKIMKNRKNEIRQKIVYFVKSEVKNGIFPTSGEINRKFGISVSNYFENKTALYKAAGIDVEIGKRIIRIPRPLMRRKIIGYIRASVKKNHFPTGEDISIKVNSGYLLYFPSIKDAYKKAGVWYPGKKVRNKLKYVLDGAKIEGKEKKCAMKKLASLF